MLETLHWQQSLTGACRRIPPLWDLPNYVAVNPFLGYSHQPVDSAARSVRDGLDADALPRLAYFQHQWARGAFNAEDLAVAAHRTGHDPDLLMAILTSRHSMPMRPVGSVRTFAERYDRRHGTSWQTTLTRWQARWLPTYLLRTPEADGLYAAWRESAQVDRSLELLGLADWRSWIDQMPPSWEVAIEQCVDRLPLAEADHEAYFYRLLGGMYGWASYLRRLTWPREDSFDPLGNLLAIRLVCDTAMWERMDAAGEATEFLEEGAEVEDEAIRLAFLEATEQAYRRALRQQIRSVGPTAEAQARPLAQAVFCIDVRSEVLRRHLEAQSPEVHTSGFAGFFGVPLRWQESPRCPVLLHPAVEVCCDHAPSPARVQQLSKHVQAGPGSAYTFVETLGLGYALGLLRDTLGLGPRPVDDGRDPFHWENPAAHLDTARGILHNLGLTNPGRLVLLCGHEAHSANNPHAAGLACGACGGHGGAINARAAVALLNHPLVRVGLNRQNRVIPDDTVFVAGIHDTTTDTVTLLDTHQVPASHQAELATLRVWLQRASQAARSERAASLGFGEGLGEVLERLFGYRSRDIAEVRPEWALAGNAAFLAARRERTRGSNLAGRVFLHDYDESKDADMSILKLILSAPMVVASWINLQYLASTVDNDRLGAGNKTLHNRVGTLGVVLGNGGDLCTGLPLQSVHRREGVWYHEPLRLQVIVETSETALDQALAELPDVRALVENGWVRLHALSPHGDTLRLRTARGWELL
jgi:uncharacterized protein YbcC (UPF0753/DUF2309 family)